TALAAHDRPFSRTAYLPEAGVDRLSFATFPANILLPDTFNFVNPSHASGCAPPVSIPAIRFGPRACGFDFASVIDTVPPIEQVNVIARAIYQLNPDHQVFGELVYGHSDLLLRISPSPATGFA